MPMQASNKAAQTSMAADFALVGGMDGLAVCESEAFRATVLLGRRMGRAVAGGLPGAAAMEAGGGPGGMADGTAVPIQLTLAASWGVGTAPGFDSGDLFSGAASLTAFRSLST